MVIRENKRCFRVIFQEVKIPPMHCGLKIARVSVSVILVTGSVCISVQRIWELFKKVVQMTSSLKCIGSSGGTCIKSTLMTTIDRSVDTWVVDGIYLNITRVASETWLFYQVVLNKLTSLFTRCPPQLMACLTCIQRSHWCCNFLKHCSW